LPRFQLSKFRLGPEYVSTFQQQLLQAANEHLREFYPQSIAPIASHLAAVKHLIIAPHILDEVEAVSSVGSARTIPCSPPSAWGTRN
jgi:hypothetical protein